MEFFVFILILIISLFSQIFKYNKVKANAFSKAEVVKAAQEQAMKMKKVNTTLTCEYCGSMIDTSKEKFCPQCGAPYDNSPMWLSRFDVNDDFIEESTDQIIEKREKKAQEESKRILKGIKVRIIILSVLVIGFILIAIGVIGRHGFGSFKDNEKLNDNDLFHYVDGGYEIDGDGLIYEDDDVKISVSGIYYREDSTRRHQGLLRSMGKVGITVENKSDKDLTISLHCNSINGISSSSPYLSMYGDFRKNKTVTLYPEASQYPGEGISELIFDQLNIYCQGEDSIQLKGIKVTTSHEETQEFDLTGYTNIFTNDKADIYVYYTDEGYDDGYILYINNKTDKDVVITTDTILIDGQECSIYGLREVLIPASYEFRSDMIDSYDEAFDNIIDKEAKINISFSYKDDPTYDFSTGYMDLNQ